MRRICLIIILILAVLISGCIGGDEKDTAVFVGGNDGLAVSFVGNNPPARVFQNRNFNVILRLENVGESTINAGDVQILFNNGQTFGVDDSEILQFNQNKLQRRIKAETGYIPGGIDFVSYNYLSYSGPAMLTEDSPISFSIDVCYPYKTYAVADVCVSREPESDICNPMGEPEVHTSGGPILITKLDQLSSYLNNPIDENNNIVTVELRIYFEFVGEGKVYDIDADCNNLQNTDLNVLTIEQISIGSDIYRADEIPNICPGSGDNKIGLDPEDASGFITCLIPVKNVFNDFTERFTIAVGYKHHKLLTKQISIMPVLGTLEKCVSSADCKEGMYCEQPGFCRNKIPEGEPCGRPMKYENPDITCRAGSGSEQGYCNIKTPGDLGFECVCSLTRGEGEYACYTAYEEYECKDEDDGGRKPLEKGNTALYYREKLTEQHSDFCFKKINDAEIITADSCYGKNCYLREYYCDGINLIYEDYQATGEEYVCEGGELKETNIDCEDSDGGIVQDKKGTVTVTFKESESTGAYETKSTDQCFKGEVEQDCSDEDENCYLIEYYCDGVEVKSEQIEITAGRKCEDGRVINK